MQSLFDDPIEARAEAMGRAEKNAAPDWKALAYEVVLSCAEMLDDFTSDEVLEKLDQIRAITPDFPHTHNTSALGPVIQRCAREGRIKKTGTMRLSKFSRRHRDLTVWTAA